MQSAHVSSPNKRIVIFDMDALQDILKDVDLASWVWYSGKTLGVVPR